MNNPIRRRVVPQPLWLETAMAVVAYWSTTAFGAPQLFLVVAIAGCWRALRVGVDSRSRTLMALLWAIGTVGVCALPFGQLHGSLLQMTGSRLPLPFALIGAVLSATLVGPRFRSTFVYLTAIEVLVCLVEGALGVRSVLPETWLAMPETEMGTTEYRYKNQVFGLSINSSFVPQKVLWALIALGLQMQETGLRRRDYLVYVLLLSSCTVTFGRTAVVAMVLAVVQFAFLHGRRTGLLTVASIGILVMFSAPALLHQLRVGKDEVGFSERDSLALESLRFIAAHPVFGNYGFKFYMEDVSAIGSIAHSHNSYLMAATAGGVPLLGVLLWGIVSAPRARLALVLPILLYGLGQSGFFWGMNLWDQLLFSFLFGGTVWSQSLGRSSQLMGGVRETGSLVQRNAPMAR
jgi:hypothetical protein